jgi:5-methylcytosine-specific restriction endonuclease McrA
MKIFARNDVRALAANPTGKLEGPNGRVLCRWCGTETKPPRRTFCSDTCVHAWNVRANPGYARQQVYLRDKGVCALCGVDTSKQRAEIAAAFACHRYTNNPSTARKRAFLVRLKQLHIPLSRWHRSPQGFWDMDHLIPVAEGGGACGLDNLRTLCLRCHYQQTRQLSRRRTQRSKRARPKNI